MFSWNPRVIQSRKGPSGALRLFLEHAMPKPTPEPPSHCDGPECHRPIYAGTLCQTHHRQRLLHGTLERIRPYRRRREDTVKLAGLRIPKPCAELLQRQAAERDCSVGAAIADALEHWWRGEVRRSRRTRPR